MRTINLDEARAARAEAEGSVIEVIFKADTYSLPTEIPAKVVELAADLGDVQKRHRAAKGPLKLSLQGEMAHLMMALMKGLLGPEEWERFSEARPSVDDLTALLNGAFEQYGASLGESAASASSSGFTGEPPRPTSPASTPASVEETSGKPAGVPKPSAAVGS